MLSLIDGVLHQPLDLRAYRIHQFTNLCCSYVGDRTCNLSIIRWTLYRILIIVQEKKYILFVFNTGGGSSHLNSSSGLDSDIPPSHGGSILSGRSHSIVNSPQDYPHECYSRPGNHYPVMFKMVIVVVNRIFTVNSHLTSNIYAVRQLFLGNRQSDI